MLLSTRLETRRQMWKPVATISWDSMIADEPSQEMHRSFPIKRIPPKLKAE